MKSLYAGAEIGILQAALGIEVAVLRGGATLAPLKGAVKGGQAGEG